MSVFCLRPPLSLRDWASIEKDDPINTLAGMKIRTFCSQELQCCYYFKLYHLNKEGQLRVDGCSAGRVLWENEEWAEGVDLRVACGNGSGMKRIWFWVNKHQVIGLLLFFDCLGERRATLLFYRLLSHQVTTAAQLKSRIPELRWGSQPQSYRKLAVKTLQRLQVIFSWPLTRHCLPSQDHQAQCMLLSLYWQCLPITNPSSILSQSELFHMQIWAYHQPA